MLFSKEILIAKREHLIDRGLNSPWIHCGVDSGGKILELMMTVMSNLVAFFFSFFSMSENYILTVPDLVIFFKMLLKKHKLYHLIKEIDLGLFFFGVYWVFGLAMFFFIVFRF